MKEAGTIVSTRKIQLIINSEDKEVIGKAYKTLYQWQNYCFRAANFIFTHHYLQESIKDLFYFTDEVRIKLSDIKKDADGILTTSKMNTTYQVLSKQFKGEMPMNILSCLNNNLVSTFNKEKTAYWKGEKSLRNYKRDIPIPFGADSMRGFCKTADERNFQFTLFSLPFKTYLGKDYYDKKMLLAQALTGEVKLCTSSIQIKKNKIYLLATFQWPREKVPLKEAVMAEAELSIEYPIVVTIGKYKYQIGNKEEFLHRRLALQAALHRSQQSATSNHGGKGRTRKLKNVDHYKDKEKAYVNYKLHVYSRRLIDLCIKHQAGTLLLAGQQDKEEVAKTDEFLLRNWSYHSLREKIDYKAGKAGILVITE
jgi:transposase